MGRNTTILKWLLLGGAVYFLAISAAHMFRIKVPLLFMYFNVPSYEYQDHIISFLTFGWSSFLFAASRDPKKNSDTVKAILIAGSGAVTGLHAINIMTDFRALAPNVRPTMFHAEAGILTVYVAALFYFYFLARHEEPKE